MLGRVRVVLSSGRCNRWRGPEVPNISFSELFLSLGFIFVLVETDDAIYSLLGEEFDGFGDQVPWFFALEFWIEHYGYGAPVSCRG